MADKFATVEAYLASLTPEARTVVDRIRATVHEAAPGATEGISYNILVFRLDGKTVIFVAGWKAHAGLYPVAHDYPFEDELAPYRAKADTIQFRYDRPVPYGLVAKIVRAKVERLQSE
ncbi:MAG: iron chaperone [Bauldia sp.]